MADKQQSVNKKSVRERVTTSTKERGVSKNRIYADKHSNVIGYLYESEISEIDGMIQSASKLAKKKD